MAEKNEPVGLSSEPVKKESEIQQGASPFIFKHSNHTIIKVPTKVPYSVDIPEIPRIYTGTAAPATTPAKVGDLFIDTTNHKIYVADGTTNSSNWVAVN